MRVYTVHLKDANATASPANPDRNLVLVKDGFCWGAVFLSFLWAAWHRMWLPAAVIFAVFALSGVAMAALKAGFGASFLVHTGMGAALGFWGNALRRWHLGRAGYTARGGVGGANIDEAEERYFREAGVPAALQENDA